MFRKPVCPAPPKQCTTEATKQTRRGVSFPPATETRSCVAGVVTAGAESRRWVPSRESAPPRGDPVVQGLSSRRVRRRAGLRRRLPGPRAVCPAPPVSVGAVGQPPGGHLSAFGTSGWFTRPSATAYDERMRCLWSGPVAPERFLGGGSSSHNALCWPCDFLPSPPP